MQGSQDISNVTIWINFIDPFDGDGFSDENKCAIHTSFSSNENWIYDWSNLCTQTVFQPQTKEELQTAVNLWIDDNTTALSEYGEINTWDVSLITDMSNLFKEKPTFNSRVELYVNALAHHLDILQFVIVPYQKPISRIS